MRRLAVVLAAIAVSVVNAPASAAAGPVVYVADESAVVTPEQIAAALPAFQTAVTRDLAPVWGTDATLTTDPAVPADMRMTVEDGDCGGCLGYHDVAAGKPFARVYADASAQYNEDWRLVFTHELEEMLVDPWVNRLSVWSSRVWLAEVSDPCEDGLYAYWIDGVPISDFITPRWYDQTLRGPYDFARRFRRAGQIGRHGYASYLDPSAAYGWSQVFGFGQPWHNRP